MDLQMKSNWNAVKGELKEKYGSLVDDDLTYVEGKEEQLIAKLQKALGKSKDKVTHLLREISDRVSEK